MRFELGMTLLEIMVTMTIIGLMIVMATASLSSYNTNATIRTVTEEINLGLRRAKVEAITRNTPIQFVLSGTSWQIILPASGTTAQSTIAQRTALQNETNITIASTNTTISFNGRGYPTPAATSTFAISFPSKGTCVAAGGTVRCLQVEVTSGGRIKSCDPSLATTDPRSC